MHRYQAAGDFDKYPTEDQGGSIRIMNGDTMTPQEFQEYLASKKGKTEKVNLEISP